MGIDLRKTTHQIFFILILPFFSVGLVYLLNFLLLPISDKWYFPLIDSLGALGAYSILYSLFDQILWKKELFQRLGIVSVPDLSGRWRGNLVSTYSGKTKIVAFLEIDQSFSKISTYMYTQVSESFSITAEFLRKTHPTQLVYVYKNDPNGNASPTMHSHSGTVILTCDKDKKSLRGYYFNENRHDRGFVGQLNFKYHSKNLKGTY